MDVGIRINVRTSDDIDTWLYTVEKACYRSGLRFRGKKMTKEAIVNALLASIEPTDGPELIELVKKGLAKYEKQHEAITSPPVRGS